MYRLPRLARYVLVPRMLSTACEAGWCAASDGDAATVPLDEKLARGISRQAERLILGSSDEARRDSFAFAVELLNRNRAGRKIDGPDFNVKLARIEKAARPNAATLRLDTERLAIGRPGRYHRQSLQAEPVHHLRATKGDFTAREWAVAVDHVQVERGKLSARFWTAPVLFDSHIMTRYLQRSVTERGERIIDLVDAGLPLASLYRACALTADGRRFHAWDVALPAPGGVLCGGTELVDCGALAYKFLLGHRASGWGIDAEVASTTLQMTVSVRTFLTDETLSAEQVAVLTQLRRWLAANEAEIRAKPNFAYGWSGADQALEQEALVDSFRPLCQAVQQAFTSWRRQLREDGYYDIDFDAVARNYIVAEWQRGQVGHDLLGRYMKTDLDRPA
jgi:hypothetical protein